MSLITEELATNISDADKLVSDITHQRMLLPDPATEDH
jgi:hypothetical protein